MARIDVISVVRLNWADSVLVMSGVTMGDLLTTVPHLVMSLAV